MNAVLVRLGGGGAGGRPRSYPWKNSFLYVHMDVRMEY
jgi:hypothetical protein